jgi:hypothetical protein
MLVKTSIVWPAPYCLACAEECEWGNDYHARLSRIPFDPIAPVNTARRASAGDQAGRRVAGESHRRCSRSDSLPSGRITKKVHVVPPIFAFSANCWCAI